MRSRFRMAALGGAAALVCGLAVAVPAAASAPSAASGTDATSSTTVRWAPAATAKIHPGVAVTIADIHCIAGYILTDGRRVFVAVPASCTGVSGGEPTNGCTESQVPYGLPATIQGARHKGKLVYSSFVDMQLHGVTAPNKCANNSLSLVKLDPRDIKRTNPSVPVVGGPTGVARTATSLPDQLTLFLTAPTTAQAVSTTSNGWAHTMMVDAAVNHLSVGAPVLTSGGKALGMVTVVPQQGGPGETTASDLGKMLSVLRSHRTFRYVHLAKGTVKFKPAGLR